jgi:hypothetical protein
MRPIQFALIFVLTLSIAPPAEARVKWLEPATLVEKVKKQIAKQSLSRDFNLFNGEVLDGVSAAIKYKYKAEPSYMENYYTRYDKYAIELGVNPSLWVEDLQMPFGIGFSGGTEVIFARQFKSQLDAVKAIPYTLLKMPVSAKRAVEQLNIGDFVSFQANIGLVMSVGATIPASQFFTANGSTHVQVNGNFLVHLFKTEAQKVRVKFIALRGKGGGTSVSVNALGSKLVITGIQAVDGQIKKRFVLDPLQFSAALGDSDLFVVDYVFDLSRPEVAAAYDHIMQEKMHFKPSELLNPIVDREELETQLVTDLTEVEEIFAADKDKPIAEQRIHRVFKGSNSSLSESANLKFGLNVIRFEKNAYYAQNKILSVDKNEQQSRFLFDTFSLNNGFKFFFKLFDTDDNVNANLLFQANEEYKPESLVALVLSRERRMSSLTTLGLKRIKEALRQTLPSRIYAQIQWKDWDYEFAEKVNVSMQHQISFSAECLEEAEVLSSEEIQKRVHAVMRKNGIDPDARQYEDYGESQRENPNYRRPDIDFIVAKLTLALDKSHDKSERYKAFVALKNRSLFIDLGAQILFALLPDNRLEELVHYKLVFSGRKSDQLEFQFGKKDKNELYDSLLYIQGILNNRSIDLRTFKE